MGKKLNPIERSHYIDEQYKDYLRSSFNFGKGTLQDLFIEQLKKEKLFKGPYVDLVYPFKRGHNLDELIDNGVVCKSFHKLSRINFARPLYAHQEEAIKLIKSGRSAVVTTGTGSGKTECFLFPLLNDLLLDVENGNNEVGIRAIFLYPMNALVNDQVDRIREILRNCPEITYGFYTGETPETISSNYREKLEKENGTVIPPNELLSRAEIRDNPPHFLFTNYSMLEYLMIRPHDITIFQPQYLKNWKFVILDEAHTYSGSLGIELSLLLRRLTGLAEKKPRFILTSATLGEQGKAEKEIVRFATSLTSAEFHETDIIFSKRIRLQNAAEYRIRGEDYSNLKVALEDASKVKEIAESYCIVSSNKLQTLLYELLSRDENVHVLSGLLKNGSKEFSYLLAEMQEYVSENQLIDLIDIINKAEKDGIGLFDLKYHSFVRPLAGAYITFGDQPKLSLTKTNEIDGLKAFEIGNCKLCGATYVIGKIQKRDNDKKDYLFQNKEVDIYENYGNEEYVKIDYFLMDNSINEEEVEMDAIEPYEVCAQCGEIHAVDNLNAEKCKCGDTYRRILYRVKPPVKDEEAIFNNIGQCPCCGNRSRGGIVKALNIGKDEGTALIAQILYEAIDEGKQEEKKIVKLSLKPASSLKKEKEEGKVKQYLTFSDSRQQASFAAVFFDSNHIRMLRKRLIWEVIKENDFSQLTFDELTAYLTEKIKTSDLFPNNMGAQKNAWAAALVDLLKIDGDYDGERSRAILF